MKVRISRKRRHVSRKARRNPRFGAHRPTLLYTWKGWKRPRHSKLFKKSTRVNPKHRRHYRFARRNPALPFGINHVFMGGAKIAGGIALGFLGMPVLCKFMPAGITAKYSRFYGILHVVIGAVAASMIRNKMAKEMALIVAGTGVYDLLASNVTMLGLPALPRSGGMLGDEPGVVGMGASYQQIGRDYAPALGSSYETVGSDDISYGGDEIEIG